MPDEADPIEAYGRSFVTHARDRAIASSWLRLEPHARGPGGELWRDAIGSRDETREALRVLIPEIVDEALFQVLNALDNEELPACAPREGLGELAGWYMGSGLWRSRYSAYPAFDPFRDLPLPPGIAPSYDDADTGA